MTQIEFGQPLPRNLDYAVSVSIPTWNLGIGYADREPSLISRMVTGYPRFFPQPSVKKLSEYFIKKYGKSSEDCRPFPSHRSALECLQFVKLASGTGSTAHLETENFIFQDCLKSEPKETHKLTVTIAAVLASSDEFKTVKEYWKLRGEIVSGRLAESINQYIAFDNLTSKVERNQFAASLFNTKRKGELAKKLIRKRIINNHCKPFGLENNNHNMIKATLDPDKDVHLVPSGMAAIFTARKLLEVWEERKITERVSSSDNFTEKDKKSTCTTVAVFGFLFKNTQVIMEKFGKSQFFGFGNSKDILELQKFLESSEQRIIALYVETPSNPLLNMPDLLALRRLADEYGFYIVVDDTIGGVNLDILNYADIVCTSLTKLFSGASNVMGGSLILNPNSPLYSCAYEYLKSTELSDLWLEDALVLEYNSRDYEDRTLRTNLNTETLLKSIILPEEGKVIKKVYYPTVSSEETLRNYETFRNTNGGYGCLFSLAFHDNVDAEIFYDSLTVFKGPSNGTNFTLVCPYTQIVHRSELEEVSKFGVDPNLIRVSVGLEEIGWLQDVFSIAIKEVQLRHRYM